VPGGVDPEAFGPSLSKTGAVSRIVKEPLRYKKSMVRNKRLESVAVIGFFLIVQSVIGPNIRMFNFQRAEHVLGPGVASTRMLELQTRSGVEIRWSCERGMQRPFRLRKAYGATGRLGVAMLLDSLHLLSACPQGVASFTSQTFRRIMSDGPARRCAARLNVTSFGQPVTKALRRPLGDLLTVICYWLSGHL
jgi:hypothetical protein